MKLADIVLTTLVAACFVFELVIIEKNCLGNTFFSKKYSVHGNFCYRILKSEEAFLPKIIPKTYFPKPQKQALAEIKSFRQEAQFQSFYSSSFFRRSPRY